MMSGSLMTDGSGLWTGGDDLSGSGLELVEGTNDTSISCRLLLEQGFPSSLSASAANTMRCIQIIYYSLCYPVAFLLNAFVVFIIVRFKKLHSTTFYLALQIIIIDVANIIIFFPSSMTNAIADRFVFEGLCPAMGFLTSFLFSARNLLMFVLVADRFCLIFLPFWYSRHRVKVVVPLSIAGWLVPLTITLVAAIALPDCFNFQRFTWVCLWGGGCEHVALCTSYSAFLTTLINLGTFIVFLLYLALLCRAKKLTNKIAVAEQSNESAEDREIAKQLKKREQRANTTFLILFIALVGVTFPTYIVVTLGNVVLNARSISPQPGGFTVIATLMTSLYILIFIMDPVVIMRNQDVKEVLEIIINKLRKRGREIVSLSSTTGNTTSSDIELQTYNN